jgi:hypothetical protein
MSKPKHAPEAEQEAGEEIPTIILPPERTFVVKFLNSDRIEMVSGHQVELSENHTRGGMVLTVSRYLLSTVPQLQGPVTSHMVRAFANVEEVEEYKEHSQAIN